MATKKAKSKTTKKKAAPVNKKTVTRVVSTKTIAEEAKTQKAETTQKNVFVRFFEYMLTPNTIRMIVLEMLGVFIIGLTYIFTQAHPMYLAFSMVGVYAALCHSNGGFFNPAFSFGAWITRKISGAAAILQIVAQALGAMLALIANNLFAAAYGTVEQTELKTLATGKEWYVFAAELIGVVIFSLFLVRIINRKNSNSAEKGLAVGFGAFAALLVATTFTNFAGATSIINPSLLVLFQIKSNTDGYWVWVLSAYVIAPLIGGVIGFLLGNSLEEKETTTVK